MTNAKKKRIINIIFNTYEILNSIPIRFYNRFSEAFIRLLQFGHICNFIFLIDKNILHRLKYMIYSNFVYSAFLFYFQAENVKCLYTSYLHNTIILSHTMSASTMRKQIILITF